MTKFLKKKVSKVISVGVMFTFVFGLIFAITPINKASALSYDYSNPYQQVVRIKVQSPMKQNISIKTA